MPPRTVKPPPLGIARATKPLRSFTAAYAGRCATCGGDLGPGDAIFYVSGAESASGVDCCGDRNDTELTIAPYREPEPSDDEMTLPDLAQVLPRRRAAPCPSCFQIPASNGVCGCA